MAQTGRVPHLAPTPWLDLPDSFASHVILAANFFEGPLVTINEFQNAFPQFSVRVRSAFASTSPKVSLSRL